MRGKLRAVAAAVAVVALATTLTGCVGGVRGEAEDMLHKQVDQAVKDVSARAPQVTRVADIDGHVSFLNQSNAVRNGSLDPVATGWYRMEDRPDHTGVIEIIAVGTAFGNEALAYTDALVFRCVRITTNLGVKNADVHEDRIDCPAYVRRAAHIIPDTPEV